MIYSFFYRTLQNLIMLIIGKKSLTEQLNNYLDNNSYAEIHDIGCSDGLLAQIINFTKKLSKNDHVIAIDGFYHQNQNIISIILKRLDQGNFIRSYNGYKKLLKNFTFSKKINYYLRFYSHLLSFKNIDKLQIQKYF